LALGLHDQPSKYQASAGAMVKAAQVAAASAERLPAGGQRVAIVGCGTSLFMAEAWAAAREQLAQTIVAQGGKVAYVETGFEQALQAEFHIETSLDVRTVRYIGVDGPRWFLRGTIEGAALADIGTESAMESLFRSIVVNRGDFAMPPGEMLELTMPPGNVAPPRGL
jgi:hypothetical protein